MAYLEQNDKHILDDIIHRKEFSIYANTSNDIDDIIPRFLLKDIVGKDTSMQHHSYQSFVSNFMNPDTPNTRLFMQWSPGMGKTIGSLSIALKFINYYKKMQNVNITGEDIGYVWILGFSEDIFRAELIKFPEFGFITETELSLMNTLKESIHQGNAQNIETLNELRMRINRRLSNRQGNGFFKFMGYRALLNRTFITQDITINISSLNESDIAKLVREGKLTINLEFMKLMKHSLFICDEIHDVYNSAEKNNWGVALQTILNFEPTIRAVFLSATPFNNSPTEIIDLLNLLTPKTHFPEYKKSDFFTKTEQLIESKIPELYAILSGRVSYITNNDPNIIPAKGFIGEKIPGVDYLKFIRCHMSSFHYKTYKYAISKATSIEGANESNTSIVAGSSSDNSKNLITLSSDSQYVVDYALPDPQKKEPWTELGIYKTGDVRGLYKSLNIQWKNKYKLGYDQQNDTITGDALSIDGNLKLISAKYYKMTRDIINLVKNHSGKIFIYHNVVHMSGVIFIGEVLKANGFISENATSTDNTLCSICGEPRIKHKKEQLIIGSGRSIKKINKNKFIYSMLEIAGVNCKLFSYSGVISFLLDPHGIQIDSSKPIHSVNDYGNTIIEQKELMPYDIILLKQRHDIKKWLSALTKYKKRTLGKYYYYFSAPKSKSRDMPQMELIKYVGEMLDALPELSKQFVIVGSAESSSNSINDEHQYMPCRFTLVHSYGDNKKVMARNRDLYNSITNLWGDHLMILIGGRIMKQSINLVGVQHLYVMSRPDNIPTMLQIIGRAVRTNSHILLPKENRLVKLSLYTSTLPDDSLSYEEIRYKQKIESFKVIQKLERILHEVAIDKSVNYNIIFQPQSDLQKKQYYQLDILPYADAKKKHFKLSELNLHTFDAYYGNQEVNLLNGIIRKLFVERSPVWKYADLLNAVRTLKGTRMDMSLILEENFILALDKIVLRYNESYVEPDIQHLNDTLNITNLYNKLINPLDKYIYLVGGRKMCIVHIGEYYMMVPINTLTGTPIIDIEMPFRIYHTTIEQSESVRGYLAQDQKNNFTQKKEKFINKWENVDVRNLELAVCDYGTAFHIKIAEELIAYVFNTWTNPKHKKSPHHIFYFKLLYYYDLRKIIIWAHTLSDKFYERYKTWALPITEKLKKNKDPDKKSNINMGLYNMLASSINKSNLDWISTGMVNDFNHKLKESIELFDGHIKKSGAKTKVDANYLPVGHFIGSIPRLYDPHTDSWNDEPGLVEKSFQYKENELIIGYDERTSTGITVKFKLRNPIQNIKQFKDTRLIERGIVCSSKSKNFLRDTAKKIGIDPQEFSKDNVEELCSKIRIRLIYMELKARSEGSNIKYFYFLHELKPETMLGID